MTEQGLRVYNLRRCPKCGDVTDRFGPSFVKGPPLIPQLDDDTPTVPCEVVVLEDVRKVVREALLSFDGNWDEGEIADHVEAALAVREKASLEGQQQ